jgi:hypothetical protein
MSNKNGRHWEDVVGYKLEDLKIHIEKQFDSKMSWDNYGTYWHIDHIIPRSYFSMEQTKDCWALENLRPLEAKENIYKSNFFTL